MTNRRDLFHAIVNDSRKQRAAKATAAAAGSDAATETVLANAAVPAATQPAETAAEILSENTAPYLVAAWQHLVGHEYGAREFADAYVEFVRRWDWDWVKINPRAVYYAESWGNVYDENDYGGYVIPRKVSSVIAEPSDIAKIGRLDASKSAPLAESFEAARLIRRELTDRAVLQSIFSPLSVLLQIADLPLYPGDAYADPAVSLADFLYAQPEAAKTALTNIAETLADYAAALVKPESEGGAGLDGIFYAVTGTVSNGYFTAEQYAEFGEPFDRIVLDAIRAANPDAAILLHTCRDHANPEWFDIADVDILQWDAFADGNPSVADAGSLSAVPVLGANSFDFADAANAARIREQLEETVRTQAGRPFLLAPSCTVPTPAADETLRELAALSVAGERFGEVD